MAKKVLYKITVDLWAQLDLLDLWDLKDLREIKETKVIQVLKD